MSSAGTITKPLSLAEDGCAVIPGFLEGAHLERINAELDEVFSAPSFNNPFFSIVRDRHIRIVTAPTLLRSVNVLAFAVDVADALQALSPTFVPRDYLRGGRPTSGALRYMRGTHRRDFHVEHMLDSAKATQLASTVVECGGAPGTLPIVDPLGFHERMACRDERRIIRVELLRRDVPYQTVKSYFPSHLLSPRVIEEIGFFTNVDPEPPYVFKHSGEPRAAWRPGPLASRVLTAAALVRPAVARLPRLVRAMLG